MIKEFLDGNPSATGARTTWTRLKFLQTHLRYPIVLPSRPAKKAVHGVNEDTEGGVCVEGCRWVDDHDADCVVLIGLKVFRGTKIAGYCNSVEGGNFSRVNNLFQGGHCLLGF